MDNEQFIKLEPTFVKNVQNAFAITLGSDTLVPLIVNDFTRATRVLCWIAFFDLLSKIIWFVITFSEHVSNMVSLRGANLVVYSVSQILIASPVRLKI